MKDPKAFMNTLKEFDKDNISEKKLKGLKQYIKDPRLEPDTIKKKSTAGKSIAEWMHAMDKYAEVNKVVKPKRIKEAEATARLKVVEKDLNVKRAELDKIRKEIWRLQSNYKEQQMQLDKLIAKKEENQLMLTRAKKLVEGLANESQRWQESIKDLDKELANMVGNIVLAAGYISYVGCFTAKYRQDLLTQWQKFLSDKKVKYSLDFSVTKTLGDPIMIRDWNIKGLPADALSIENGIISTKAKRWPLLIDPQSQGNKWIKQMERENGLQVVKLSDSKYMTRIEPCIRNGNSVLLENIQEVIDP